MIEITRETDWDTIDDAVDLLSLHDIAEKNGYLRTDLKALLSFTGSADLSSAVKVLNTKKVLEIGVGSQFEALISLYKALLVNNIDFPASDIWAIDPKLDTDMIYPEEKEPVKKFTKRKSNIQNVMGEISGKFDLVLAKGVLSIGAGILSQPKTTIDDCLKTIGDSLNPDNKDALAIISSKTGLLLPFNTQTLNKAGLRPVFFMVPTRTDLEWEEALKEHGEIDEKPFKLVICQRLQK